MSDAPARHTADDNTLIQQALASNPAHSAWVSAHAGSGKTTVLTQRVVRLLLAGTPPSRILCLTFTKAAAGVMSNRVFKMLSDWAQLPDEDLRKTLTKLGGPGGKAPDREVLERARTLFAQALDTPGGLKIQTIHAFCEALLHQFPLEANVPGNFTALDEAQGAQLLEQARRDIIVEANAHVGSELGRAFDAILEEASDFAIDKALSEAIGKREELASWLAQAGGIEAATEAALSAHGFRADETVESLQKAIVDGSLFSRAEWTELQEQATAAGAANAVKLADRIHAFLSAKNDGERYAAYRDVLLTGGNARKWSSFVPKALKALWPDFEQRFEAEQERLAQTSGKLADLASIHRTAPFLTFVQAIAARYERMKRQLGVLDFDDQIARAADLLLRGDARAWVLYKLDHGIDHVLVDEAQDTSPRQWQIITALVEEFFAGRGANEKARTIFAVGDEKQSIYSFQGARPEGFAEHRRIFDRAAANAARPLREAKLSLSFRSTADVLGAVDATFALPQNKPGVVDADDALTHGAARARGAGQVDVWPLIPAEKPEEPDDWTSRQKATVAAAEKLAVQVAATIAGWLGSEPLGPDGRTMHAGDVLVLVRSRDAFVTALNRELKAADVPVAGADRLVITDHIAIEDLMALGQVMLTPQDDLALAGLLKSPLIGLNEDDLYRLARSRMVGAPMVDGTLRETPASLYQGLRDLTHEEAFAPAWRAIQGWRRRADVMPVYEFFALILGSEGGRRKFLARLGPEVEDVLDAFASAAMDHESRGLPGLQNFMERLDAERPQIKRELDQAGGEVRIMTVHAAKGMEAPVVFLVDKSSDAMPTQFYPALYRWGDEEGGGNRTGGWLWVPSSSLHGGTTAEAFELEKTRAAEEYRRLLYVGMTRAEDRLVLCGTCRALDKNGEMNLPDPSWSNMVSEALSPTWEAVPAADGVPGHHRWRTDDHKSRPGDNPEKEEKLPAPREAMPDWLAVPMSTSAELPRPLSPSGATALIDEARTEPDTVPSLLEDVAGRGTTRTGPSPRRIGNAVHRVLELWPQVEVGERHRVATTIFDRDLPELDTPQRVAFITDMENVVADPRVSHLFDPATSRGEVPVMGLVEVAGDQRSVTGTIDRMSVSDDAVHLLDFKTGRHVPDRAENAPASYVAQMALYRALVQRLYPDRPVHAMLVWTAARDPARRVMPLPAEALDEAMERLRAKT